MKTLQRSFAGGEITPELYGRLDLAKFQTGLARAENFIILPHGPAANRPGTEFVAEVKDSAAKTRLIPFAYSTEQTYALEFGNQYVRVHTQGATVLAAGPDILTNGEFTTDLTGWTDESGVSASIAWNAGSGGRLALVSVAPGAFPTARQAPIATTIGETYTVSVTTTGAVKLGIWNPALEVYVNETVTNTTYTTEFTATATTATLDLTGDGNTTTYVSSVSMGLANTPLEVATPYITADLFDLHYVQSADVLTIVHPDYAPRELRRLSATSWTLTTISFTPTISAPTGLSTTQNGTGGTIYNYVVTAVAADGLEESVASASTSATNDLTTAGNWNKVFWGNVSGALRYKIYKEIQRSGLYGYIGDGTNGTSPGFKDDNITPDATITPPEAQTPFSGAGNYPGAVSYFEQRRAFAGSTNKPQNLWMTRSATESNMNYSLPTQDNDALTVKVAAREANTIRHLVPLSDLMLLTSGGVWKCSAGSADALTPTTIGIKPQAYVGANNVQPAVTGSSILYAQARGCRIREISYSWEAQTYRAIDASIMAPHLMDGYTITDMAYMMSPFSVLWCVRSDGTLLGLTYVPDQQVLAWHQHTTDGLVESVCVVAEGDEDVLYMIVKRTIDGVDTRYVERMHSRQFTDLEDAFFVDCGLTYSGAPATTISGLGHLEGKTVAILADGGVVGNRVVSGGAITLDSAASLVHVGLPITAELQTLPLTVEVQGFGKGVVKNINAAFVQVYRSSSLFVGPSADKLTEYKSRAAEPYGTPPALRSDELEVTLTPTWSRGGQLVIRHTAPLPLTISSLACDVALGG